MGAGVGLDLGHLGVPFQRGVVVDPSVGVEDTAVAVVGELVQAQVGHDHEVVADLGAHVPEGDLEDAVGVGAGGAGGVLLGVLGHAEEHDPGDPGLQRLHGGLPQGVAGVLDDAGHGPDRHGFGDPLAHERGQDQVGGMQPRLGHHPPHGGRRPQPPRPRPGKGSVRVHTPEATPARAVHLPTGCCREKPPGSAKGAGP